MKRPCAANCQRVHPRKTEAESGHQLIAGIRRRFPLCSNGSEDASTAGGVAWVSFAIASLLAPPVGLAMQPFVLAIGSLAEIALALWLLLGGVSGRNAVAAN